MNITEKTGINQNYLSELTAIFHKYSSVKTVSLFGSRAKGNYKPNSDIDLAILNNDVDRDEIFKIKSDLQDSNLPYSVELLAFHTISNKELADHILKFGIPIYDNGK